jgi:hypothetical protein
VAGSAAGTVVVSAVGTPLVAAGMRPEEAVVSVAGTTTGAERIDYRR